MKIKHNTLIFVLVVVSLISLVFAFVNNGNSEYSSCYADINSGEMVCDDNSGNECISGNDCSGDEICINGMCRAGESECVNYQGYGCSNDGNAWNSSSGGTCVTIPLNQNNGFCDYTSDVRMNCGTSCNIDTDAVYLACDPWSGDSCDYDA